MDFLEVFERPELLNSARDNFPDAKGVFTQEDTWDVHIYILWTEQNTWFVSMIDCGKPDRGTQPTDNHLRDALVDNMPDEEEEYGALAEALDDITGDWTFNGVTPEFKQVVDELKLNQKLEGMSSYQRKKLLREGDEDLI
jgi:hypothetical protein